jgi:DNA-binding CsgD family transcriptional regulator
MKNVASTSAAQTSALSRPSVFRLTAREKAVASHLGDDIEPAAIGEALGITGNTVRVYIRNIYQKLGVRSRHAAVARLLHQGLQVSREASNGMHAKY